MEYWTKYPGPEQLLANAPDFDGNNLPLTNGHLHTPYSFSAFDTVEQTVQLASKEGLKAAGINDFNTVNGFDEWGRACSKHGMAPLFNIEMIGLNTEDQANDIKVNDPSNPGRTYISGKGLSTGTLPAYVSTWLSDAVAKNNMQSRAMTDLLNHHLRNAGAPFILDFKEILRKLTKGQVRERHLARAVRLKAEKAFTSEKERVEFYKIITQKEITSSDPATIENLMRGALLKAGGPAFIPEDTNSFASLETIRELIMKAKGVPTYPFLGNALEGECTDFEKNIETTMKKLRERGFFSTEFITPRNSIQYLEKTTEILWNNGFLVTFGPDHNTPAMEPLVPYAKNGIPLTQKVKLINTKSICILLAHQYLTEKTGNGWLDQNTGKPKYDEKNYFIKIGWTIMNL